MITPNLAGAMPFVLSILLVATPCAAGRAADASPVTLEGAAREAVEWHPSLIEAAGMLAARGEEVKAARAGYLPTISAGVGSGYDSRVPGTLRPRPQVGASQMLFDFGKVSSEIAGANAGTRIGRAEMLLAVDALIRDTGYAIIEYQRAAAQRDIAREQAQRVEEIGDLVGKRAALGAATRSDALQAQARVEAAVANVATAEAAERRWASNLAFLLGRTTPPPSVSGDVPDWLMRSCAGPAPVWDAVPSVMAADAQAERAVAALRRSRADRYPTVSLGGDASTDITAPFGDRGIFNFGLRVSSNIFGGGITRARVRGASYELEAAQAQLEAAAPPARGPAPPSALAPPASPPSGVGLLEPAPARDGVVSQRPAGRELREAKPDEARAKREADAEEATDGQGRGGRRRPLLDCQFSDLSVPDTLLWLALTDYFD